MENENSEPEPIEAPKEDITSILSAANNGDQQAASRLLPLVYHELRALAQSKMAQEQPGQTLNATAVVHEAYLRLVKSGDSPQWDTRGHFFAAAAEAMRRILVEISRRKGRLKHGGQYRRVEFVSLAENCEGEVQEWADDILELDVALSELAEKEPEAARLVELRYFSGLTMDDAAKILGYSDRTARRHWAFAKAWLYDRLNK